MGGLKIEENPGDLFRVIPWGWLFKSSLENVKNGGAGFWHSIPPFSKCDCKDSLPAGIPFLKGHVGEEASSQAATIWKRLLLFILRPFYLLTFSWLFFSFWFSRQSLGNWGEKGIALLMIMIFQFQLGVYSSCNSPEILYRWWWKMII